MHVYGLSNTVSLYLGLYIYVVHVYSNTVQYLSTEGCIFMRFVLKIWWYTVKHPALFPQLFFEG